jgi:hypothetical protein
MERETKGTVLYKADEGDKSPLARNIYVTKASLTSPYPAVIDVTIEAVTEN